MWVQMKLSKLYTNKPDIFKPIDFNLGLNVVLAEIKLPDNKKKDTHNLGKTTLGRLIDFCLLSEKDKKFFLFAHIDLFDEFIFFIEIQLLDGSYITIRRSVKHATKISFKKSIEGKQNFIFLPDTSWDHLNVAIDPAKELLDSILNLSTLKPWTYRNALSYLLRSQDDFRDVFQLKHMYRHSEWKPYLAHILGFNSSLIQEHYDIEKSLTEIQDKEKILLKDMNIPLEDISKIEGLLLLKQKEIETKQKLLDVFDFRIPDKEKTKQLVNDIDEQIVTLNNKRYYLAQNKKKINDSLLEHEILFDPDKAELLFKEAGILFKDQIKKDFTQLIEFNRAITAERKKYLSEELKEIEKSLLTIDIELDSLGKQRSQTLAFLGESDIFNKYKKISDELVILKADVNDFERQKQSLQKRQQLRKEIRSITEEKDKLEILIEEDVEKQNGDTNSIFSSIRLFFSEIIEEVIDRKALLNVTVNNQYHLEFSAEILNESGNTTSEGKGFTYQKLLCIAFDMAVARAYENRSFPHFIFHDGIFESLDDRKKENLLNAIRYYSKNYGVQHIVTLIDSDLPLEKNYTSIFDNTEIIIILHDEDKSGRLFKMESW